MATAKRTTVVLFVSWIVFSLYYYGFFNIFQNYDPTYHISTIVPDTDMYEGLVDKNYLIKTPGCIIPDYSKSYHFKEKPHKQYCESRAVFIKKTSDSEVKFTIEGIQMNKYSKKSQYDCCYQFVSRSTKVGHEDTQITYSNCEHFENGTTVFLKTEVLTVTCSTKNGKKAKIYEDSYVFVKKIPEEAYSKDKWNVILLGMDTMSRTHAHDSMPKTMKYFQQNGWLDFRAYQKVGYNTYPNLMALLSGLHQDNIYSCEKGMDYCNKLMMWSHYERINYVTAYGEDELDCPDTFRNYHGFTKPPTHHYMRPFFLTGETRKKYLVCARKSPSGVNLINYAFDFANSYHMKRNFFGFFWMNSFTHGSDYKASEIDVAISEFFMKLNRTGVLQNTFIFFLGDHGLRFGAMRLPVESYYEERLPMLFSWIPQGFQKLHKKKYASALKNQFRLISTYDLHSTLLDILAYSNDSLQSAPPSGCPLCKGIFEDQPIHRTCTDAAVSEKWCSCHDLHYVNYNKNPEAAQCVDTIVTFLRNTTRTIKTTPCKVCSDLKLEKVLRAHTYSYEVDKNYYVIAVKMSPSEISFEGKLVAERGSCRLVGGIDSVTGYNSRGSCTVKRWQQAYCVCIPLDEHNCKKV